MIDVITNGINRTLQIGLRTVNKDLLFPRQQAQESRMSMTKYLKNTKTVWQEYSFRDKDIRDNILEALNTNRNLWIMIASPHASTHKNRFFQWENSSRIAALDLPIQEVLRDGKLYGFTNKLKLNLSIEGRLLTQQYQNRNFLGEWQSVLQRYFYLGLNERIEYIKNTLVLSHGLDDKRIQDEINSARAINKSYWPK